MIDVFQTFKLDLKLICHQDDFYWLPNVSPQSWSKMCRLVSKCCQSLYLTYHLPSLLSAGGHVHAFCNFDKDPIIISWSSQISALAIRMYSGCFKGDPKQKLEISMATPFDQGIYM